MGGRRGVGRSLAMEKVPRACLGVLYGRCRRLRAGKLLVLAIFLGQNVGGGQCFLGGLPALLAFCAREGERAEFWEKEK